MAARKFSCCSGRAVGNSADTTHNDPQDHRAPWYLSRRVVSRSRRTTADRKSCVRPQNAHYPLVRGFALGHVAVPHVPKHRSHEQTQGVAKPSLCYSCAREGLSRRCGYGARQEGDNSASHMRPQAKRGRMCITILTTQHAFPGQCWGGFQVLAHT